MAIVPDSVYTVIMGFIVVIVIVGALITAQAEESGLFASLAMAMSGIWWVWVGVVIPGQEWVAQLTGTVTQIAQGALFLLFATFSVFMMMEVTNERSGKRLCKCSGITGTIIGFGVGFVLFYLIIPVSGGWVYALQ